MTKNSTIKRILGGLVLSLVALGTNGAATTPDHVVYPTGEWPTDVENVQAAVDLGGIVLLKATNLVGQPTAFNFGVLEPESDICLLQVHLQKDLRLLGESVGENRTKILGGYRPITVGAGCDDFFPWTGHVSVEGITFEGPYQAAIDIYKGTGAEIVSNRILNVAVVNGIGVGVSVFGGGAHRRISGKVTIADNIIKFPVVDDVGSNFAHAIVIDNVSSDVDILCNSIENTQDFTGILVVRQVEGTVQIADNFVAPHPQAPGDGNGIGIYIYANDVWDSIRTSAPVYEVTDNLVITEGYGIALVGQRGIIDAPTIQRNYIFTLNAPPWAEGISLGGNVSNACVLNNRIAGSGAFAISIFAFEPGQLAESNRFAGNNLTQYLSGDADLFLDAHTRNTVVLGRTATVIDLGDDNRVSAPK